MALPAPSQRSSTPRIENSWQENSPCKEDDTEKPERGVGLGHSRTKHKGVDMLLELNQFLVKERVGFVKLTDTYDIFDPATQKQVGIAKEEPAAWAKWLR